MVIVISYVGGETINRVFWKRTVPKIGHNIWPDLDSLGRIKARRAKITERRVRRNNSISEDY